MKTVPWRDWSTPARIRALVTASATTALALATLLAVTVAGIGSDLRVIGHEAGPQVEATSDLYFALSDMDAQVANVLLVGSHGNLGFTRAQALEIYEKRRSEANADLLQAAAVGGTGIHDLIDGMGRYEALAAQAVEQDALNPHPPGQPGSAALGRYREATDLMRDRLLPQARQLTLRNAATLDAAYSERRAATLDARLWTVIIGLLLIGLLVLTQIYLARHFRRRLNPALVLATIAATTLVAGAGILLTNEAEHLRVAKKDAFDSVLALSQARAVSYDANADESRYLVDPQRAAQYQDAFLAKSHQLLELGGVRIDGYDGALNSAIESYRRDHADLRFGGYFGTEFRNITFTGERTAAEAALERYQVYQRADRRIRELVAQGKLDQAVAFCTSYAPGDSNWAFSRYDEALDAVITINRDAFAGAIADGERQLNGWNVIIGVLTVCTIALVLLGVRRRLAEYR